MSKIISTEESTLWAQYLSKAQTVCLASHTHPDGDAVGALCCLQAFLRRRGKSVTSIVPDAFPDFLSFLSGANDILLYNKQTAAADTALQKADLIICLDMNGLTRMGSLGDMISTLTQPRILIDHHLDPERDSFQLVISRIRMSSCCELLFFLLQEWFALAPLSRSGCPEDCLTAEEATALYTGIQTDTNEYANSLFEHTFDAVSRLIAYPIDKEAVHNHLFCTYTADRMKLMGYCLYQKLRILPNGAAYMVLTKEEMNLFHHRTGDTEGFVNLPLSIQSVQLSALFTEQDGYYRISLRSKRSLPVNKMANLYFEGGGHRNASGGKFFGTENDIYAEFPRIVADFFKGISFA